ncbi:carbohydrate kinase [Bombiscardovia nodaiensis]|uniref:Carbohydrate kinase n=1 Tax=Bombiscardovia nodaiensis TaxID=2932181 RepID=A0ABM8B8Z9_9BIFI|nr:carbohydrate kinase [Bombiscardovia nodaiensis]
MSTTKQYFLTIDNGGTNTKVIIVDDQGKQLSVSSFPTESVERRPGFREVNPDHMWQDIGKASRASIAQAGINPSQISAVAPVGHGKGLYLLDQSGHPFMNGILSSDSRATRLTDIFESQVERIYPISHQHVMAMQFPVLLRWLKENEPDHYQSIGHVLSNKDFIRFLLTGEVLEEQGDASGNNLVNLSTQDYDSRLFDFFGIPEMQEKMPHLVKATDSCGKITADAAANTGIPEGTPVYAGLFDIDACALATGVLTDDIFSITAGTWNINVFPSKVPAPVDSGCMDSLFPTGGILVEASSPTSAGNLDYMVHMATGHAPDFTELESMLSRTDASSSSMLFLPFLYGSNVNLKAESAFVGLRSSDNTDQFMRSIYEGVAFAHRQHIDQLLQVLGRKPQVARISGGACNSPLWIQMFADVLNMPIETVNGSELGGLGGAMCSAVGSGLYTDFQESFDQMSSLAHRYEPNASQAAIYDSKYEAYRSTLDSMDALWAPLRTMQDTVEKSQA